jgi:hypothetical protein
MTKLSKEELDHMEKQYPGIADQIQGFEKGSLPSCPTCSSSDTASVQVGITGRSIGVGVATTKVKLVPNGGLGKYFCNACKSFFS